MIASAKEQGVTLRPDWRAWLRRRGPGMLVVGSILVFGAAVEARRSPQTSIALVAVGAALAAGLALYFSQLRIVVSPTEVVLRGIVGTTHSWPRPSLKGCAQRNVLIAGERQPSRFLIFYGADHHALFRVNANLWGDHAIGRINAALGYPHRANVSNRSLMTTDELNAEFPGSLNSAELHSGRIACIVGTVMLALTAGVLLLISIAAVSHR